MAAKSSSPSDAVALSAIGAGASILAGAIGGSGGDGGAAVAVLSITVASAGAAADGLGADAQALARAASRTTVLRRNRFILIPGNCGWGLRREIQLRREAVRGLQIGQAGGLAFDAGYRAGGARARGQFRQQCQSGAVDGSDVG